MLSHIQFFVTLWIVAWQVPLSMGYPRHKYWSGLPFPPPSDLPHPGIEPTSPALQADSLPAEPSGKPLRTSYFMITAIMKNYTYLLLPSWICDWKTRIQTTKVNCHSLIMMPCIGGKTTVFQYSIFTNVYYIQMNICENKLTLPEFHSQTDSCSDFLWVAVNSTMSESKGSW